MGQTRANSPFKPTSIAMKATSSASKAQIISLLTAGYPVRQVASQTHWSISTISQVSLSTVQRLLEVLEGTHPSSLPPTSTMPSTFSALTRLKMQSKSPGSSETSPTHPSHHKQSGDASKSLIEGCGEEKEAPPLSQAGGTGWTLQLATKTGQLKTGRR